MITLWCMNLRSSQERYGKGIVVSILPCLVMHSEFSLILVLLYGIR